MINLNLTGKTFGKLTVISFSHSKNNRKFWFCKCECGNTTTVSTNNLQSGNTIGCGCLKSHSKHMLSKSKLYNVWKQINQRCTNSRCMQFKYYGGRGILVCDEWINDFQAFHDWAIEKGYKSGLTIDRINNDGNYTPENCQWVTMKEQGSNKRRKGTAL